MRQVRARSARLFCFAPQGKKKLFILYEKRGACELLVFTVCTEIILVSIESMTINKIFVSLHDEESGRALGVLLLLIMPLGRNNGFV